MDESQCRGCETAVSHNLALTPAVAGTGLYYLETKACVDEQFAHGHLIAMDGRWPCWVQVLVPSSEISTDQIL